ncbi:MAG: class I SAM-dependent methyltransferase [Arthrobacter sp.]|nr:class I SAM-dependent methyltransferase [Arthrobacter sp.]
MVDAGCGTGRLLPALRAWGVNTVIGVDPSEGMLEQARRVHPEGTWLPGSLERLPLGDSGAAGLLGWYSMIHLEVGELRAAAAEAFRVLAPGAPLLWGFHCPEADVPSRHMAADGRPVVLRALSVPGVAACLQEAGLELLASGLRPARPQERSAQGMVLARKPR